MTKKNSITQTLIKGSASSFTIKILGAGLAFILQIILARLTGEEEYGIYTYIIAWATIAAMLSPIGANRTAVKFIPTYISTKNYPSLHAYIKWISLFTILTSSLVAILGALSINYLPIVSETSLINVFMLSCVLVPLMAISQIGVEIIRAFRHVALAEFANIIIKPTLIIVSVAGWYITTNTNPTTYNVLIINICTSIIIISLLYTSVRKLIKPYSSQSDSLSKDDKKIWLSTALPFLFVIAGNLILGKTDIIMLGIISSTVESGLYNAASRISQLVGFPLLAINMILAPLIAQLHAGKNTPDLHKLVRKAAWFSFISCFALAAIIYVFSDIILGLFGDSFTAQNTTLEILMLGQIVSGIAGPAGYLLAMTGNQKILALIVLTTALLNIILNYILIPEYGTNGAAFATLSTIIITTVTMATVAIKRLKINPTIFS